MLKYFWPGDDEQFPSPASTPTYTSNQVMCILGVGPIPATTPPTASYIELEDGSGNIALEDGSGAILLESSS